ncbi:hypothetical protein NQZ68_016913 [Dissostichus eleginoides]|nr:hypothetical protein NQZ68_016913 [Dissostichus eleginoides]
MEELNDSVQALMSTEEEKEVEMDQDEWYNPKAAALEEFTQEVLNWIADAPLIVIRSHGWAERLIGAAMASAELDGPYPPYGYADMPLESLPLDPDLHETYIPDMTYDPRQAYPEPL